MQQPGEDAGDEDHGQQVGDHQDERVGVHRPSPVPPPLALGASARIRQVARAGGGYSVGASQAARPRSYWSRPVCLTGGDAVADAAVPDDDAALQEGQRHKHDQGDEGQDQRVLDQPLPLVPLTIQPVELCWLP